MKASASLPEICCFTSRGRERRKATLSGFGFRLISVIIQLAAQGIMEELFLLFDSIEFEQNLQIINYGSFEQVWQHYCVNFGQRVKNVPIAAYF